MSAMSELDIQLRESACPACEYRELFGEEGVIYSHTCEEEEDA